MEIKKKLFILSSILILLYTNNLNGQNIPFKFLEIPEIKPKYIAKNKTYINKESNTKELIAKSNIRSTIENENSITKLIDSYSKKAVLSRIEIENDFDIKHEANLKAIGAATNYSEIKALNELIKSNLKHRQAMINDEVVGLESLVKYYQYIQKDTFNFRFLYSKDNGFLVNNSIEAEIFYENAFPDNVNNILRNTLLAFNTNAATGSIFNELYYDYLGPLRLNFGALISSDFDRNIENDTIEILEDSMQKLIGGGGNVSFSISYPIFKLHIPFLKFYMKGHLKPKFNLDVPPLSKSTDKFLFNSNLGLETAFFISGSRNSISFFGNYRYSRIFGAAQFFENLGITNDSFNWHQLTLGVAFNSSFRFSYSFNGIAGLNESNSLEIPNTLSFSIIPN